MLNQGFFIIGLAFFVLNLGMLDRLRLDTEAEARNQRLAAVAISLATSVYLILQHVALKTLP